MNKVIVYDLDDTLYKFSEYAVSGFSAASQWLEKNHRIGGLDHSAKQVFSEGQRGNIFNVTLERMGLNFNDKLIDDLINVYRNHKPNINLLPEALDVIQYFNKYKQAIITDGILVTQKNKIEALGLPKMMSLIICTDEIGGRSCWKPSPLPYQKVMQKLGDLKTTYFYIGDDPSKDFVTAKKLGWQTIRIRRPGSEHYHKKVTKDYEAHYSIASLTELKRLID